MIKKITSKNLASVYMAALLFFIAGCGYKFTGGGELPWGGGSVFVNIFENRSSEAGIENTFTNDMIYEFTRNGQRVASGPDSSGAVVYGVIKSVSEETVTHNTGQISLESRVSVVVDILVRDSYGDMIKSLEGIVVRQVYTVDADNQGNLANRKKALEILSKRFAENVYGRLTENF